MFLCKRPNGVYYIYSDLPDGTRKSKSTGCRKKADANRFLATFKADLPKLQELRERAPTLNQFTFEFLKHSETVHTDKTNKAYRTTFRHVRAYFGDIRISELTRNNLQTYLEHRHRQHSVFQSRKDHIHLSAALNYAADREYIKSNPMRGLRKPKLPQKQPKYFSVEEFEQTLQHIKRELLRDLATVAFDTGLRLGEITAVTGRQVDIQQRLVILNNHEHLTKGKTVRSIPLNDRAFAILQRRKQKHGDGLMFPNRDGNRLHPDTTSRDFKEAVRASGVNPALSFHSLRHGFASRLVQAGAPIRTVQRLLGHANVSTTEIYSHLQPENLKSAVDLLNK